MRCAARRRRSACSWSSTGRVDAGSRARVRRAVGCRPGRPGDHPARLASRRRRSSAPPSAWSRDHWTEWAPFPSLSFDPAFVAPSGAFQPPRSWTFTVALTQPLFDGGAAARAPGAEAGCGRRREARVHEHRDSGAVGSPRRAGLDRESPARVRARAPRRRAGQRSRDASRRRRSRSGATTNIEVIDAQREARDAETAAALAEDAVRRARLDLLVALGRFPK